MAKEFKSTPFALFKKDKLGERTRAGIFAVLGNRDHGGDRILPGAFAKTFGENKRHVRHLWNHNFSEPPTAKVDDLYEISRADLPEQVLSWAGDAQGAAVVVRTYLDTSRGNEILAALDAEAINEMSFAYDALKKEFVEEEYQNEKFQTRIIKEVRHFESSDVLWGMNPATLAQMGMPTEFLVKSLEFLAEEIKAGRRNSDADLKMLQQIHDHAAKLGALCAPEEDEEEKTLVDPAQNFGSQLQLAEARLKAFAFVSRAA